MATAANKTPVASTNYSSNNGNTTTTTSSNSGNPTHQDPAAYFLAMASESAVYREEERERHDREDAPTELNTINSSGGFVAVSTDKLSVKYTHVNHHGHDVGAVQANKPAPVKRLVYYFEMTVRNGGARGQIAIGFTHETFKMCRQPGWEVNSCGYHGDDGHLYHGQGKGLPFGPTFTTKDTVGAGINYASQEFFFTKNGALIGTVKKEIKDSLFPTVAVHSQNEEIEVNFGQKQFAFDIKDYERQERMKQHLVIDKISLPQNVSHGLVRSYLLHYGYQATLNSFELECKSTVPPILMSQENGLDSQDILYALNQRRELRQLIRNGEIDAAISKLHDWFPQILEDENSATCFLLHCQKFIELVRIGELEEAVNYGRIQLAKFFGMPVYNDLVQDCVSLLAYEQPLRSSVGYLLEDSQRDSDGKIEKKPVTMSSVYYHWKSFDDDNDDDRPEKPRRYGVTEMRGPQHSFLSQNMLQDIFESIGQFVDGLKFSGGSHSLMPKSFLKEVIDMAHRHDVYVSTGDWAEHLLRKGPSAFKDYVEECKSMGFDTIELNMESLGVPEDTLLRYVRLIKSGGLKAKPQFAIMFNKSDIPVRGNRAFGAYVPPAPPRSSEVVEDVDLLIRRAERCLEAGADMIMIDADDLCKDADRLRADIVAKIIGRLGVEKTMFEASNPRTSEWFVKRYGPKVNLFVDHSQVIGLECLRSRSNKDQGSAFSPQYFLL